MNPRKPQLKKSTKSHTINRNNRNPFPKIKFWTNPITQQQISQSNKASSPLSKQKKSKPYQFFALHALLEVLVPLLNLVAADHLSFLRWSSSHSHRFKKSEIQNRINPNKSLAPRKTNAQCKASLLWQNLYRKGQC